MLLKGTREEEKEDLKVSLQLFLLRKRRILLELFDAKDLTYDLYEVNILLIYLYNLDSLNQFEGNDK